MDINVVDGETAPMMNAREKCFVVQIEAAPFNFVTEKQHKGPILDMGELLLKSALGRTQYILSISMRCLHHL